MARVEALYEHGALRPTRPLALRPGETVSLIVVRRADPARWRLGRLGSREAVEDLALAEQGLADWADGLDEEDRG